MSPGGMSEFTGGQSKGPWRASVSAAARILRYRGEHGDGTSIRRWLVVLALTALVAALAGPVIPPLIYLPAGLAISLALSLLAVARDNARRRSLSKMALEWSLLIVGISALGASIFGKVLDGSARIDTGDHQIMSARAQQFAEGLVSGRWLQWTHWLQGGDSLTDLYPFFSNLVTAVIYAVLPDRTPFSDAYAYFVILSWGLRGIGAYYLARRFAGPGPSVLVALAACLDVGKDVWDGVWSGALYWGMVHSAFALTLVHFAAALLVDVMRERSVPRGIGAAVLTAVSCLSHPLGFLAVGLVLAGVAVGAFIHGEYRGGIRAAAYGIAGVGLSAFWVLPFGHAMRTLSYSNAVGGFAMSEAARGLLDGSLPTSSFAAWVGFVVVALLVATLAGDVATRSLAIAAYLCWFVAFQTVTVEARLYDYFPGLLTGQQRRFLTVLKVLLVPAVAWTLELLSRQLRVSRDLRVRSMVRATVLVLMLGIGPLRLAAAAVELMQSHMRAQLSGRSNERSHTGKDYHQVFEFIRDARSADPSTTPWRVWIDWRREWRHAAWSEGFALHVPVIDPISVPGNFLGIRPREYTLQGLANWNVRFVITDYQNAPFDGLTKVKTAGRFTLFEVKDYNAAFVEAPPGVQVSNVDIHGDQIEFDVSGAAKPIEVRVRCAWYPRWRAYGAGVALRAAPPHPGAGAMQEQLLVTAGNGRVVLRCDGSMPRQTLGTSVTLLSLLGLVWSARGGRGLRWRNVDRLRSAAKTAFERVRQSVLGLPRWGVLALALGSLALGTVVMFRRGHQSVLPPPLFAPWWLEVSGGADGEFSRCRTRWLVGKYVCSSASVTTTLGSSARELDATGEYARLWPGISVNFEQASVVRLEYRRFALKGPLVLESAASGGPFEITASFDSKRLGRQQVTAGKATTFSAGKAFGTGTLVLEIRASSGGWLAFTRALN